MPLSRCPGVYGSNQPPTLLNFASFSYCHARVMCCRMCCHSGTEARAALVRYAPSLALAIGPAAPQLLQLIQHPPKGSHELLLAMITALAESQPPPQPLVQACLTHYQATGSVQLLVPVTHSLSKDQVVSLLPKLLMQLPDQRLRLLYRRLALSSHGREPLFAPVELLVLLHKITSEPDMPQATFKANGTQIMSAIDRAMRTPEVFPAAVMQTVRVSVCL